MKEKKLKAIEWIKEHKKEIIIAGVGTLSGIAICIILRKKRLKPVNLTTSSVTLLQNPSAIKKITPLPKLTGEQLTAKGLGNIMHCSAQKINNLLVEKGFAERLPCGEYIFSEIGKPYGEKTLKVKKSGYTFSNIEWDKSILEQIFTPDEISEAAERTRKINEWLNCS